MVGICGVGGGRFFEGLRGIGFGMVSFNVYLNVIRVEPLKKSLIGYYGFKGQMNEIAEKDQQ